jgi:hypothetical protein
MKSVEQITELEEENLKAIKKHHLKYRERERAMGANTQTLSHPYA